MAVDVKNHVYLICYFIMTFSVNDITTVLDIVYFDVKSPLIKLIIMIYCSIQATS